MVREGMIWDENNKLGTQLRREMSRYIVIPLSVSTTTSSHADFRTICSLCFVGCSQSLFPQYHQLSSPPVIRLLLSIGGFPICVRLSGRGGESCPPVRQSSVLGVSKVDITGHRSGHCMGEVGLPVELKRHQDRLAGESQNRVWLVMLGSEFSTGWDGEGPAPDCRTHQPD